MQQKQSGWWHRRCKSLKRCPTIPGTESGGAAVREHSKQGTTAHRLLPSQKKDSGWRLCLLTPDQGRLDFSAPCGGGWMRSSPGLVLPRERPKPRERSTVAHWMPAALPLHLQRGEGRAPPPRWSEVALTFDHLGHPGASTLPIHDCEASGRRARGQGRVALNRIGTEEVPATPRIRGRKLLKGRACPVRATATHAAGALRSA